MNQADQLKTGMFDSMVEGNRLYDHHGYVACLAMDEVLDTITELEVAMASESFVRPCAIQTMVDLLHNSACNAVTKNVGVCLLFTLTLFLWFVMSPTSFCSTAMLMDTVVH